MREGFWINFRTDKTFEILEHEEWVRDPKNARKLGLSASTIAMFPNFRLRLDREKFLLFILMHEPVMRVRGHGDYVAFEYASRDRQNPMEVIEKFGKQNFGPFTALYIANHATHENTQMTFQQFEAEMTSGGAEAVLRVADATVKMPVNLRMAKELLVLSKELLRQT